MHRGIVYQTITMHPQKMIWPGTRYITRYNQNMEGERHKGIGELFQRAKKVAYNALQESYKAKVSIWLEKNLPSTAF